MRARREEDQTELEPGKGRAVTDRKRWEGASSCRASDQQARKTKRAQATDSDIVPVELKSEKQHRPEAVSLTFVEHAEQENTPS